MPVGEASRVTPDRARAEIDRKTKPIGALGDLEEVAVRLAVLQGTLAPRVDRARVIVFAADHGVADEGVSAYPREVTAQMMANFARGGAAVTVLARAADVEIEVVDVGVDADLEGLDGIVHEKIRRGSRNLGKEPSLLDSELGSALEVGATAAMRAIDAGVHLIGIGEMGIGNTTAAATLLSALTGDSPEETVGRGTGIDDARLHQKVAVVRGALDRFHARDPRGALAAFGGLEIAAMAGAVLECARHRVPVVADGFISGVAALAALRMDAAVGQVLFASHRSAERGHEIVLHGLGLRPLLDLGMRLGEGSGAVLAIPILRAGAAIMREMATFESAGVSDAGD